MLTQSQIKHLRALGNRKYREESGRFTAEGHKLVKELCAGRLRVAAIYALPGWIEANPACCPGVPVFTALPHQMEKITRLSTPGPVIAEICIPEATAAPRYRGGLVLALDGIRDPGNLGTILRIADWFGIGEVACSGDCVEPWNPKVVQATMGSIARVQVHSCHLADYLATGAGMSPARPVFGAFLDGESMYAAGLTGEGILVIGNESRGISPGLEPFITRRIRIPSYGESGAGKAESLNASVAAAILCAEFRRGIAQ